MSRHAGHPEPPYQCDGRAGEAEWVFQAEQETRTGTAQHGAGPAAPMLCAGSGPAGVTAQVADVVRGDLDVHEAAALDQLP